MTAAAGLSTTGVLNIALNAVSMVTGVLGAVLAASNTGTVHIAYGLFLISSVTSVILMWGNRQQRGLLLTQAFYVLVNIVGLLRWSHVF
jgi:nicotinamide riboside transporter PnuC